MKTKFLLFGLLLGLAYNTQAQTTVSVSAGDSTWMSPCQTPAYVDFYVNANLTGYTASDSATVYINFGDGQDTTFINPIWGQGANYWLYSYATHAYSAAGWYSLEYRVTMPDGNADTLYVPNEILVGDTCGSIDGQLYNDMNSNCMFDAGDLPMAYQTVTIHQAGNPDALYYTWTDSLGNYYFNPPINVSYDIRLNNYLMSNFNATCPASGVITTMAPASNQDFALECSAGFDLATAGFANGFVPGSTSGHAYIGGINQRCLPTSGQLKLLSSNPLITATSYMNPPDAISGDTMIWNFSNLSGTSPYYNYWSGNGTIQRVSFSTDTTAQIGDTICFEVFITPFAGDANPADNYFAFCSPVRTSYDPNDKAVTPLGSGADGYIASNQTMTYTVRFQNTGTAAATNVAIIDSIDTSVLDLTSLRVITASHAMTRYDVLNGDAVRFKFDNINLPDSNANEPLSHGFIMFEIDQLPNLPSGTVIDNTADIYFDWNPAVITNTTHNTIEFPVSIGESFTLGQVLVYPNPTEGIVTLDLPEGLKTANLEVYSVDGRLVMSSVLNAMENTLDLNHLSSGLYHLRLSHDAAVYNQQLVIE